ncbi:MAG: hypothetical protein MJB14_01865 [Spirochaetes bacterium]|nr:hypothetical protein [Spirochaetota bacterium]
MNIRNSINDGTHPSSAHLSIWYCRQMLADFHEVDEQAEGLSLDQIRKGEKDFHDFICRMYDEMYRVPGSFQIPVGPYDEYMKKAGTNKVAEKAHFTDAKESKLRNEFQQAIQYYAKFLYEIGIRGESISPGNYMLNITSSSYAEAKKASRLSYVKSNPEDKQEAWEILGIQIREENSLVKLSNTKNPYMFIGLWLLCHAPESAYKYMNYLRVDFKGCHRAIPGIEDIKETILPEHGIIIDRFEEVMVKLRIKRKIQRLRNITSGFQWKVEYIYKGKNIFGFYAEPKYLMLCIYFNKVENINELCRKILEMDEELFQWFQAKIPERLCKCRSNRWAAFGENRRRICGLSCRAEVVNPSTSDVTDSIKIMKLFRGL